MQESRRKGESEPAAARQQPRSDAGVSEKSAGRQDEGVSSQLMALQRSAGNRAVQVLVQRHTAITRIQRAEEGEAAHHPAEDEEIQRAAVTEPARVQRHAGDRAGGELQRADDGEAAHHPAEDEEIQRAALPGLLVQRVRSRYSVRKRMEREYGVGKFGVTLRKPMLNRLDEVMKLLPRSHTKGNASLAAITGGTGQKEISVYDDTSRRIEMNLPKHPFDPAKKMPLWLYLLLSKGIKWMRTRMDAGAMAGFGVDATQDAALGLTGKRELMGGVSKALAAGRLVDWTIRHELGHSVDEQTQAMNQRGKLNMFGGWQSHTDDDSRREVAKAFLTKAGFSDSQQSTELELSNKKKMTLLGLADSRLTEGNVTKLSPSAQAIATALGISLAAAQQKTDVFDKSAAIAAVHPWTFSDGGGDPVSYKGRIYHINQYNRWVSYLADARKTALSNYQFSAPGEWFAEVYAAYYDPREPSPARAALAPELCQWFATNLGPPSFSRKQGRRSGGKLSDDQGKLGTLTELDKAVEAALNDPTKMVDYDVADLPEEFGT